MQYPSPLLKIVSTMVHIFFHYHRTSHILGLHVSHITPQVASVPEVDVNRTDFSVSQYLLLPDSFGDIYIGELFSAYIAVVNGVENTLFTNVIISVRLQTANVAFDLLDTLPEDPNSAPRAKSLNPAESMDMIVKHPLSELGTHTMRVSIAYTGTETQTYHH